MREPYALVPTSSVQRVFQELGVPYSRKRATTIAESPTGRILRMGDIGIYVSKSRKLVMLPAALVQEHPSYEEYLSTPAIKKRYYHFLMDARRAGNDAIANLLRADVYDLFSAAVWDWRVHAVRLGAEGQPRIMEVDVRGRPAPVTLRLDAYLLLPTAPRTESIARSRMGASLGAQDVIVLDADALYVLCQKKLDILYLQEQLRPTPRSAVLLVLAHDMAAADGSVVGIRATRLGWGVSKPKVHGIYACSSGFGTHIQAYTEELLRTDLLPVMAAQGSREGYGTSAYGLRPREAPVSQGVPPFTLHAIPSAVPIWKSAFGFTETQKKKGQLTLLTKNISPGTVEERAPTTTKKRKASRSASSGTSAASAARM